MTLIYQATNLRTRIATFVTAAVRRTLCKSVTTISSQCRGLGGGEGEGEGVRVASQGRITVRYGIVGVGQAQLTAVLPSVDVLAPNRLG